MRAQWNFRGVKLPGTWGCIGKDWVVNRDYRQAKMKSENQIIVWCKQPIKIEKPLQFWLLFSYSVGERNNLQTKVIKMILIIMIIVMVMIHWFFFRALLVSLVYQVTQDSKATKYGDIKVWHWSLYVQGEGVYFLVTGYWRCSVGWITIRISHLNWL